uniref:Uncharacterized protein n=1 Tax=Anguilla anguilla TaxID=7936 RepID=A0A0E9QIQ9_ANGAN
MVFVSVQLQLDVMLNPAALDPVVSSQVFIHCSTEVCHPSANDRCEQHCARKQSEWNCSTSSF